MKLIQFRFSIHLIFFIFSTFLPCITARENNLNTAKFETPFHPTLNNIATTQGPQDDAISQFLMAKNAKNVEDYDEELMQRAFYQAKKALEEGEVPIGCVFSINGTVVAEGRNEVNKRKNPTAHAEIVCIEEINREHGEDYFGDAVVYVNCEPCIMCASALQQLKVKGIFYGCSNPRFGGCGTVLNVLGVNATGSQEANESSDSKIPPNKSPFVSSGHREEEAVELLKEFYKGENPNAPEEKRKPPRP